MNKVNILENGKEKEMKVVVGETTPTEVVIQSGIKVGDKVVVK